MTHEDRKKTKEDKIGFFFFFFFDLKDYKKSITDYKNKINLYDGAWLKISEVYSGKK